MTLASGDRTGHALAWEVNARIAIVEGNLLGADDCFVKAVAAVENFAAPLGAWRVYATAAELHRSTGNTRLAQRVQELRQAIVVKLASSLEEPLRQTFPSRNPSVQSPSTAKLIGTGVLVLLLSKAKNNAGRISDVVLMAAEASSGAAQSGAVELSHHVFHLNGFDRDAFGQAIVQSATSRGSEGVLRCGGWTTPRVSAAEKKLHIRI